MEKRSRYFDRDGKALYICFNKTWLLTPVMYWLVHIVSIILILVII